MPARDTFGGLMLGGLTFGFTFGGLASLQLLFSNQNYSFMYRVFLPSYLKHFASFWWFYKLHHVPYRFFDLLFIRGLRRNFVMWRKIYNYTNTIDVGIT